MRMTPTTLIHRGAGVAERCALHPSELEKKKSVRPVFLRSVEGKLRQIVTRTSGAGTAEGTAAGRYRASMNFEKCRRILLFRFIVGITI